MQLYEWLNAAARERGSAKALVYRDTYLSWRGLQHRVERRAQEFAGMGIGEGHWVGLMLGNVPDFATLALALSKLGATVVPLDPTTVGRDLQVIMDTAPLRALITRPRGGIDTAPPPQQPMQVKPSRPAETPESRRRLQGTLLTCSIYKRGKDSAPPEGATAVLFTSDSSGEPKGVLRTRANLEAGAESLRTTLEVTPEDRILTTAPLYHAYGFDLGLVLALRYGATLYLEDEVAPKRIVKILREQEIDLLPGTPALYAGLAKLPTAKPLKIKRARYLAAGAPLTPQVAEAFRARWGIRPMALYHSTETQTIALDRKGLSPDSVGKAADGVEVRADEAGVIWVRSAAVAKQSIGAGPAARPNGRVAVGGSDAQGWFRTGDLGKVDKSGRVFLAGREDDLVKVDGKRVALGEVEGCLESFAKVKAAKARVITDPLGGPMVVAKVVVLSKCGAEEIIDHCARNLAPYKVPRRIEFSEAL